MYPYILYMSLIVLRLAIVNIIPTIKCIFVAIAMLSTRKFDRYVGIFYIDGLFEFNISDFRPNTESFSQDLVNLR